MSLLPRIVLRWFVPAGLATAICILVYLCAQQVHRQLANDPQIQMAHDIAARLNDGASVQEVMPTGIIDVARSLAPFVTVVDNTGKILASTLRLHGVTRTPPSGVLDGIRQRGEERVTWQPERGVRIATVGAAYSGGVVIVGRSLWETEDRIQRWGRLMLMAWGFTLVGLLVLVSGSEYAMGIGKGV